MIYANLGLVVVIVALIADRWQERRETMHERGMLLHRIQAPERAIMDYGPPLGPSPPAVGFDDDEAFHATREDMVAALERSGV